MGAVLICGGVPCHVASVASKMGACACCSRRQRASVWRGVAGAASSALPRRQRLHAEEWGHHHARVTAPCGLLRGRHCTPFCPRWRRQPRSPSPGATASMSRTPPRRVSRARYGVASSGKSSRLHAASLRRRDPASGATTLHPAPRASSAATRRTPGKRPCRGGRPALRCEASACPTHRVVAGGSHPRGTILSVRVPRVCCTCACGRGRR